MLLMDGQIEVLERASNSKYELNVCYDNKLIGETRENKMRGMSLLFLHTPLLEICMSEQL